MRRFLALLGFAALSSLLLASVPARAQQDPASRALHFLAAQQAADGHVDGFDTNQGTEDYLLGAAAAGYDPNAMRSAGSGRSGYDFLAGNITAATATAGRSGRLLQALAAGGRPPAFAGVDVPARLQGFYSTGLHPGQYGDSDAFSQALVILGLRAAGLAVPAPAVQFLKSLQNPDGSWYFSLTPQIGDTNDTALAIVALDAAGDHSRDASALTFLRTQQQPDGGFPYQALYPGSDPDSTALVVEALLSSGQAPSFTGWTQPSGGNPYSYLVAAQDGASGGYLGFAGTPDAATTVQAVVGLALATQPVPNVHGSQFGLCAAATAGVSALRFLARQQSPDGHLDGFSPSQGTEDFILGAAAAGYDPATLRAASGASALDYLAANVGMATASPGATGRLLEAVRAAGRPSTFAGVDLVAKLQSYYSGGGHPGQYGDSDAFGQALAILGLKAAAATVPGPAITFLKSLQNGDGSWHFSLVAQAGDTNDTAMALMALAAVGDHSLDGAALAWLRSQQATAADGGFPYQATFPPSDADSTALVLQALYAADQDPAAWTVAGATPISFLAAGQDRAGGGYPGYSGTPDAATTVPTVVALERLPYPIPDRFSAGRPISDPGPMAGVCFASTPAPAPSPSPSAQPPPAPAPSTVPEPSPTAQGTVVPPLADAPSPTPAGSPSPSPSTRPSPSPVPSPTGLTSPSPMSSAGPRLKSSNSPAGGGGLPLALVYGLAAVAGLVLVGGGGAAYLLLVRR